MSSLNHGWYSHFDHRLCFCGDRVRHNTQDEAEGIAAELRRCYPGLAWCIVKCRECNGYHIKKREVTDHAAQLPPMSHRVA